MKILESINEKILSQTEVDSIQEEMLTTEKYTIDIKIKFRKLKAFLEQQTRPKVQTPPPLSLRETASIQESQSTSAGTQINAKALPATSSVVSNDLHSHILPKLTLPSFDGDILKWKRFWDCF
ncbi:hypothetical protein DPMN_116342 [Dreissena polymorpha]|uniref:Uncharacterized protein n=1 Tax=Dreissena polymorpha TaxID=45954 RepID=A0A9D4KNM9_DREPO|nr:hypothetical protein DPMN_116342 [Dreissena polymorpha]